MTKFVKEKQSTASRKIPKFLFWRFRELLSSPCLRVCVSFQNSTKIIHTFSLWYCFRLDLFKSPRTGKLFIIYFCRNVRNQKFAPVDHKVKAVVYWASGTGKTVFGWTAPKPIFASAEGGLLSIADKEPAFVEIKSLNDLKSLLQYLQKEKHDFETVVIDSITEINDIIKSDIEKKTWKSMQLQDWGHCQRRSREFSEGFATYRFTFVFHCPGIKRQRWRQNHKSRSVFELKSCFRNCLFYGYCRIFIRLKGRSKKNDNRLKWKAFDKR